MQQHNLNWIKDSEGKSYTLDKITPPNRYFNKLKPGVYLIWNQSGQAIYVGQGNIGDRLSVHRQTYQYQRHQLWVSWAEVDNSGRRNGIEVYLHEHLDPRDSTCNLTDLPIPVNLP